MKKIARVMGLIALASVSGLASCQAGSVDNNDGKLKIIMLTDKGTIDDKNFNQGTWEGITAWAEKNGLEEGTNYSYIKPADGTTAEYEIAIQDAADQGADVIICPGFLFQEAFENLVPEYPNIKFVGLDFAQTNIADCPNSVNISFKENESGFLAGYAAAADQHDSFGFMGGQLGDGVQRYAMGYVAGIAYAKYTHKNDNADIDASHVWYCGAFTSSPEFTTKMSGWYETGTDVIFGCAGGAGQSVLDALNSYRASDNTDKNKKWMIGVDVDEGAQDGKENILLSATKGLSSGVQEALDQIVNSDFTGTNETFEWGGKAVSLGTADDAAGLGATTRFTSDFTLKDADYTKLYNDIKSGAYEVFSDVKDINGYISYLEGMGVTKDNATALANAVWNETGSTTAE